ncbi:glycerol-3-phosphate acyltransferase 3 isoform X3 [Aphidius gifuensis]|uniref:glycerol-3-phosphate acyltransferase 3 isoform X3 n=1 Tax=Aphidius gifuensis TaxID=684658 RepID=UPI001CDD0F1B|nr:glycerol-3-phosphate acyltransferase 3 isoform X3 [Aphidius gifuensis]
MALFMSVVSFACSLLLTPFLMFLLAIIFLASIGKSLGIRKLYIKILLALFEFGRQNIENVRREKAYLETNCESEDEGGGLSPTSDYPKSDLLKKQMLQQNGTARNVVIARSKDLILSPDPSSKENGNCKNVDKTDSITKDEEHTLHPQKSFETLQTVFDPAFCLDYIKAGVEAIIEDEVTSRFEAEELKNWNLLTRTNRQYEFISWKLTVIWMCGFFMRYCFLLPLRILICFVGVMWLTVCTAVVGYVPESNFKRWLNYKVSIMCFAVLSSALSSVITYHNSDNRPVRGICVANHTSPIDVLVLMCDNCYSLIGQRHGGFLGILQRALARASPHIWFERSEVKDREAVTRRLKKHVSDPTNPPILIFPEGTCINNTSVMQFKKGSFEVGGVIYPVAIKYDPRFGDAFWNSSRYSMIHYLYMMMSSWAIVCDVWYLPPMYREEGESSIDFANRVKSVIARQGGLVDLQWDGQLKRMKPKKEWREKQQEEFSKRLKIE